MSASGGAASAARPEGASKSDLVSWLRSVLDEHEQIARAAIQGPWQTRATAALADADHLSPYVVYGASPLGGDRIVQVCMFEAAWQRHENAAHMVANDPAHVLRTIAAHRAILGRHSPTSAEPWVGPPLCRWCDIDSGPWPCPDVLDLAAIYQDRAGFDPSWRADP